MSAGPIVLRDVALRRGGRAILEGLSAEIPQGAATAVVGPSGAGKSTLLAVVAGLEAPDSGTVENPFAADRTGVVLQNHGLVRLLTAAENVELALQPLALPARDIRARAAEQLDRFGLRALADRRTDQLSGGQQQRLAIARALVIDPELVIADELTSELDPRNRERTLERVLALRREGTTVLLATHDLDVAGRCDHVLRVDSPAPTRTDESVSARGAAALAAAEAQRRRIAAQQEVVQREQARLEDMRAALARLTQQRDGA